MGFYLQCWWERCGYYRPCLGEIFSGFFWTITWSILVHLAWPRARFGRTKEGYKMICQEIHETHGLPVPNPTNVRVFKVQNGEYREADEPQKPQNFVRPSKWALKWCPNFTTDVSLSTFCQELKYAKWVLLSHGVLLMFNPWVFTCSVGGKDVGIIGHV